MWQWLLGLLGSSGSLTGDLLKSGGSSSGTIEQVPPAGVQDPNAALAKTMQSGEAAQSQSLGGTLQGLIGDTGFKGKDGGFGLSESLMQANQQAQAQQVRQQEAQRQQALQAQLLQQQQMWRF